MLEKTISVKRTARYFIIGDTTVSIQKVFIAFHGYGQLASLFGKKFDFLATKGNIVIVPEALSRFYLDAKYDRIGASWITREMKEAEVEDSINFVNEVVKPFLKPETEIHLFGFSQGCSMVLRWANQLNRKVTSIVIWAGFFAKGLQDMIELEKLEGVNCQYIYGDKDEFLVHNPAIAKSFQDEIVKTGLFKITSFDGTHRVPNSVLKEVYNS